MIPERVAVIVPSTLVVPDKEITTWLSTLRSLGLTDETVLLLGDGHKLEFHLACEYRCVIVFRPYFLVDSTVPCEPKQFYAANRQKIWNADRVIVLSDNGPETKAALKYARNLHRVHMVVSSKENPHGA